MDADDSGGAPDPSVAPMGAYAANPVTVTAGGAITCAIRGATSTCP